MQKIAKNRTWIPAGLNEALREHRAARTRRLTTGTHAVNLVLQILETR
jgi:hypothetical protein